MVCLQDQLPLLKFGNQEAVSYEARWLSDEITKAAHKAGHPEWFFAGDITRAVIEYLRHRFPRNTITIEELYGKIERVLGFLGCDDIAQTLEIAPPPVRLSLAEIAHDAGTGYELEFFRILGDRIAECEGSGTRQILCDGLRCAVKRICGACRWNNDCEKLAIEIGEFITRELTIRRSGGELGLILR
jgi:hypothetical protein